MENFLEYIFICIVCFFISGLTLFSGFGLGTILLPFFAIFFPIDLAVALTAIVHFMSNVFKLFLLGKFADKKIVLSFGLPAVLAALIGAEVLFWLKDMTPLARYSFMGEEFYVTPIKLTIALVMFVFTCIDVLPRFKDLAFNQKYLPVGGLVSGFFGGLSGHQGALRSAFLLKCGLSKEGFIGTGIVIACMVDFSRLFIYIEHWRGVGFGDYGVILIASIISALLGVWWANRLLVKITLRFVQILVSIMLFVISILLGSGLI